MSVTEKALGDTLALVNIARQAFGHEPLSDLPRARPGDSSQCLYARALKDIGVTGVGGNGDMNFVSGRVAQTVASLWGTTATGQGVKAPTPFAAVIAPFDGHKLPQYEAND